MVLQYNAAVIQSTYEKCNIRSDVKINLDHLEDFAAKTHVYNLDLPVKLFATAEGAIHGWPHLQKGRADGYYAEVINPDLVTTIPGEETDVLGELCKQNDFYLIGQMQVLDPDLIEDRVFNMAFILDPKGKVIHRHIKTGFFGLEAESTAPGDIWELYRERCGDDPIALMREMYPVARTPIGNIGTLICGEGSWPEAGRALALNGAEIIWRATASEPWLFNEMWEVQNRSYAIANSCYVLSPNHGNPHHGRSQAYNWRGQVIADAPYIGDAYLTAMLNIDGLRDFRVRSRFPNFTKSLRAEQFLEVYRAAVSMGVSYPSNLYMDGTCSRETIEEVNKLQINRMVEAGAYTPPPGWRPYEVDPEVRRLCDG